MAAGPLGRNRPLSRNLNQFSKGQLKAKKAVHKRAGSRQTAAPKAAPEPAEPETVSKPVGGSKNSQTRTVLKQKTPAYYPAEDVRQPKVTRKTLRPAKLRASITPGTVLILLAGKHRGKRVVTLKQLQPSGLLLVTGPYKLNGVPLRRVNPAYVIATSTKIDISGVKVDEKLNDAYFKAPTLKRSRGTEAEFFAGEGSSEQTKKSRRVPKSEERLAEQKSHQKTIDSALISEIQKTEHLASYLGSTFGLKKGQAAHALKF